MHCLVVDDPAPLGVQRRPAQHSLCLMHGLLGCLHGRHLASSFFDAIQASPSDLQHSTVPRHLVSRPLQVGAGVGTKEGDAEGIADGAADGDEEGAALGLTEGVTDGAAEGVEVGLALGLADGVSEGASVGVEVGVKEGIELMVGSGVGVILVSGVLSPTNLIFCCPSFASFFILMYASMFAKSMSILE